MFGTNEFGYLLGQEACDLKELRTDQTSNLSQLVFNTGVQIRFYKGSEHKQQDRQLYLTERSNSSFRGRDRYPLRMFLRGPLKIIKISSTDN